MLPILLSVQENSFTVGITALGGMSQKGGQTKVYSTCTRKPQVQDDDFEVPYQG